MSHGQACSSIHEWQMAAEEEAELLVGPMPPDLGAELEAASGDERSAAVARILR